MDNVPTRSTIMDTNSYRGDAPDELPDSDRQLVNRREQLLGPAYRLFYQKPVHLVRGEGAYVWDAHGTQYLDVYNNVVSVGHCHPAVAEAVGRQLRVLNTHTRYLHEGIVDYAQRLLATMPAELDQVMFMCTGSEANDLAVRVAQVATGARGVIVTREAYHGTSALTSGLSPALGSGQPLADFVRLVDAPDTYRGRDGSAFAADVRAAIDDLVGAGFGFAALLADSIFSSDGVLPGEQGMLREAVDEARRRGGMFIADEVQPGFARTGEAFWGFARHGVVPDLVTMGKPMGNGFPVSGMAARAEALAPFATTLPYFNTFGGNPVAMAAGQAVLDVIEQEGLQQHSGEVGARLLCALQELGDRHPQVGDVRGAGLFIGFELVRDPSAKTPDKQLALQTVEALRERRVLTSVAGPHGNVLKLRPPLAFQERDIDWLVSALDEALGELAAQ
ncbi:aminotransferase class-III [Segniliparus rotundus DSM 44985]|uniref:Aminotransferase class-III n=1 Tax=Segniliparus rotundus (strain ATCC BAA-972 / CDC 1076 / CIP 108378 / DSM 44985 / JCM 13578) TaxID=640132 RepID=D6Z854_SEGRD|nr:aminotransferase class-III [Segniliparus rotundus DSM 44985]